MITAACKISKVHLGSKPALQAFLNKQAYRMITLTMRHHSLRTLRCPHILWIFWARTRKCHSTVSVGRGRTVTWGGREDKQVGGKWDEGKQGEGGRVGGRRGEGSRVGGRQVWPCLLCSGHQASNGKQLGATGLDVLTTGRLDMGQAPAASIGEGQAPAASLFSGTGKSLSTQNVKCHQEGLCRGGVTPDRTPQGD